MNIKNKLITNGYVFALLATILWSGNFIVARDIRDIVDPFSLSFYRWFLATIILLPFAIVPLIKNIVIVKRHFIYLSIVSILGVSLFNTLIYIASHTSSALNLSIISITFPIIVIIISRAIFKEHIGINKFTGILIVLAGVLLLITRGDISVLVNISFNIGDLWVLLAAISFAVYSILLRYKPKSLSMITFQLITFILGTMYLTPLYLMEFDTRIINEPTVTNTISILYIAICSSLLAFIFWNKSIELLGATKAGMIYYTLPIFTGSLAFIFLDEIISYVHLFSILLIFIGIYITNKNKKEIL
ncbi:DMT family transporter [Poseidonibacter lekithochrous]|uniref:DMT family transporter n=1 Tax=Poseidonibacter lekithochrous TaxID=1904463 RepID=UPI0008FC6912|nr:DMT family transporter [Poseidonibacter lekithochrous]QKJ23757.1 EamA/RhaT family transporter [Poseidonibacter lekithochrous]